MVQPAIGGCVQAVAIVAVDLCRVNTPLLRCVALDEIVVRLDNAPRRKLSQSYNRTFGGVAIMGPDHQIAPQER